MNVYRAFLVNGQNHITHKRDFEAKDDDAAVELARQWTDGHLVEVWRDGIFIDSVTCNGPNARAG